MTTLSFAFHAPVTDTCCSHLIITQMKSLTIHPRRSIPLHLRTNLLARTAFPCAWLLLVLMACSLEAQTPLVNHADTWRYRKGTSVPQASWKTLADTSLDGTWLS